MLNYKKNVKISTCDVVKLNAFANNNLGNEEIVLYKVYFPDFKDIIDPLFCFLDSIEKNRAERFHKEVDRNRFIIYRSVLKFVLASFANLDAKNIHIDYHSNKKPYLASHPWLFFNISHSEDFAVIAVSRNEVGIDIEYIAEDFNFTNLLPDIFEDNEILEIHNAYNKKHAFYQSWTRKEAFVKALGKGIDDDFKYIPCLDGEHKIDYNLIKITENWHINSFDFADHYLGAVAYENSSTFSKKLVLYTMPNKIKDLLEITKISNI